MSTELEYYQDSSNHGNYQYVTLQQLINDYMMSRGSDNRTSMIPRHNIIYQFKRGIREFYYDVAKEIDQVELDLSSTLQIPLPHNCVSIVRLSYIDDSGKLHPLAVDNSTSIAKVYLQDNDYNILFDNNGEALTTNSVNTATLNQSETKDNFYNCYTGFSPNKNLSSSFPNGSFKIDKQEGVIYFSSDVKYKRISIEYISDGLYTTGNTQDETKIRVHKFAESAIMDYVYYSLIKNSIHTPANEKHRARKEYYNSRRIAKRRINSLSLSDIKQIFKSDSKWIK